MENQSSAAPVSHFIPEVLDRLYAFWDENPEVIGDWNIHRAFVFWAADVLETRNSDVFTYSDGPDDRGIDFYTADGHRFTIAQCKCPAEETLEELAAAGRVQAYDSDAVNQIVEAVHFLKDRDSEVSANQAVQSLRHDYNASLRQAPGSTVLTARLVLMGELTQSARQLLQAEQGRLERDGVQLAVVDWRDIAERLRPPAEEASRGHTVTFTLDDEKDPLKRQYWTYFLGRGADLVRAFRDHGYALFDWNVRAQLKRSPINRKIRDSLSTSKGRKRFHHLNNGLLICARTIEFKRAQGRDGLPPRIVLKEPQVINGCQTVTALHDAWTSCSSETELDDFERSVRVQIKVIDLRDPAVDEEFIGELIVSTNDQNPMSPRNLKSNARTQVELQRGFSRMAVPVFYERKDGEFDALLSERQRRGETRPQRYRIPGTSGRTRNNFRILDNDKDVARPWHALLGFSGRHTMGTVRPFEDQDVYRQVFAEQPTSQFWDLYSKPEFPEPRGELFCAGGPSAYQLMLAATLNKYAGARRTTLRVNRQDAVRRLVEQGRIRGKVESDGRVHVDVPEETVSQALLEDTEYNVNRLLDNAQPVITELLAFLLVAKYGALGPVTCRRILGHEEVSSFVSNGFARPSEEVTVGGLLATAYAHVRFCFDQYYRKHKNEILTAPRSGRTHVGKRDSIMEMRREVLTQIEEARSINFPWKPMGKTILDCLPSLREPQR